MTEESPDERAAIDAYVQSLKSKIPTREHDALESRLDDLLNDSSADADDVISILHREFDPEHSRN